MTLLEKVYEPLEPSVYRYFVSDVPINGSTVKCEFLAAGVLPTECKPESLLSKSGARSVSV